MPRLRTLLVPLVSLILFPGWSAAQPQTKDQQKCTNAMNLGLLKVSSTISGEVLACLQDGSKGKLGETIETCAARDRNGKIAKAETKLADSFTTKCTGNSKKPPNTPRLPPYGVTDAATVSGAADTHARDLMRDAFGPDLDLVIASQAEDKSAAGCQASVARSLAACRNAKLGELNRCKKAGLKSLDAPIVDPAGIEGCFGLDPNGKIAKACDLREEVKPGKFKVDGIRKALVKSCESKGVDLATAIPGCGDPDVEDVHACLERSAECRFCLSANQADDLDRDCDLFDDGTANESCPFAIGAQTCSLSEDSTFLFETADIFRLDVPEGTVNLTCGPPDASGRAACSCGVENIAPVRIPGVGWACISPADGCGLGEISCNGGNSLDFSIDSDHDVGACTSNQSCAATCASTCDAISDTAQVFDSACEGFCEGGANDGLACTSAAQCPNGRCNGVAGGGHGNVCQCQCIDYAGEPSLPGGIRCDLGIDVRVETALPCDRNDVLVEIGSHCIPFTTESSSAILRDADNVSGEELPSGGESLIGQPVACSTLATNGTSNLFISSVFNTFDVPQIGDVSLLFVLGCE